MKAILFHCRKIEAQQEWETNSWEQALLVFVCLEAGDALKEKNKIFTEILDSLDYLKEKNVVLMPFNYISYKPSSSEQLSKYLQHLQKKIGNKGYQTATLDYETSKRFLFDLMGHKLSVAYREVHPSKNETTSSAVQ